MQPHRQYDEIMRRVEQLPEEQLAKVVSLIDQLEEETKREKQADYLKAIAELRGKYQAELSSVDDFMKRKEEEKRLDL